MTPYWSMWAVILLGAMLSRNDDPYGRGRIGAGFLLVVLLLCLMIGLRFEVGGDWSSYLRIYERVRLMSSSQVLARGDIGYGATMLVAASFRADIWLVNLLCAVPFVIGLIALTRLQPRPWLALLVAFPYLIVVVAMGYTRQGAAIGFIMLGLAGLLKNGSMLRYVFWVALGALFHKTAVIALPLLVFVNQERKLLNVVLILSATVGLYLAVLDDSTDILIKRYIVAQYASAGALIRVSMCVVPALVFFAYKDRFGFDPAERRLWRNFSVAALVSLVALMVSPSSTAVDRIALYLLPMQFVILSRIPGAVVERRFGNAVVVTYSAAVLFTWLNYAVNAKGWLPYQFWFLT